LLRLPTRCVRCGKLRPAPGLNEGALWGIGMKIGIITYAVDLAALAQAIFHSLPAG
jgi:hypothetical protein